MFKTTQNSALCRYTETGKLSAVRYVTKEIVGFEGVDNEYGASNDVKESHDTVVPIATRYGPDCLGAKYRLGARFFAPVLNGSWRPPSSCILRTVLLQGDGSLTLTTRPLSRDEVKKSSYTSTAFWFFMACCRVNFNVTDGKTRMSIATVVKRQYD